MMKFYIKVIILFQLLLVGCQTVPKKLDVSVIPRTVIPLFSKCDNSDGGLTLMVDFNSKVVSGLSLDWIKEGERLAGEVSDPVGGNVLRFEKNKSKEKFVFSGRASKSLPNVVVNQEGFLEIDGQQIGIKGDELSCFLNFKIPSEWAKSLVKKALVPAKDDSKNNKLILKFDDGKRKIWSSYFSSERKICSKIKWSQYFGLVSHKIVICHDLGKNPWVSNLSLDESNYIEWTKAE